MRRRSVNNTIEEIRYVKNQYGFKTAEFEDDIFIIDKNWLLNFLQRYKKEIDLQYLCSVRADLLDDDTARLLKESGCRCVFFGIESGNELIRNSIIGKEVTDEEIINCTRLLKRYRIKFGSNNMVGIPGETVENAIETIEFSKRIGCDYASFNVPVPRPPTKMYEEAVANKWIKSELQAMDQSGSNTTIETDKLSSEKICPLRNRAEREFYFRPFYILKRLLSIRTEQVMR